MDSRSEKQLVQACQGGDKTAYAWLTRRYAKHVYAVCLGVLGNVHDAEDIAQDVLLKGLTNINKLREGEQFGRWIARIARNLCIDYIRRKKIGKKVLDKQRQEFEFIDKEDDFFDLRKAIERLPEKYRLPLMLYYFEDENMESVARILGLSPAGVCSRLSRARKKLRNILEDKGVHRL